MQYMIVAIPTPGPLGYNNSTRRAEEMAKYDPKLVKKISHSKLIACSTEVGIKNADKVSKEMLIPAYLDAVEKAEQGGQTLNSGIVNMYNEIVTTLGLDQEEPPAAAAEPETPATPEPDAIPTPAAVPAQTSTPVPSVAPTARRAGRPAPAPSAVTPPLPPVTKEPKPPKEAKPPKEKKAPPKRYTRIDAMADTLASMKGGGLLEDLYNRASELYVAKGGTDKIIEASFFCNIGLTALQAFGSIEITDTEFKVVK